MKTLCTAFCALFLYALVAAPPVQAQTPWELGPVLGLDLDRDELLLGAVARIHLDSAPITLNPGIESSILRQGRIQVASRGSFVAPEYGGLVSTTHTAGAEQGRGDDHAGEDEARG